MAFGCRCRHCNALEEEHGARPHGAMIVGGDTTDMGCAGFYPQSPAEEYDAAVAATGGEPFGSMDEIPKRLASVFPGDIPERLVERLRVQHLNRRRDD